MVYASNKKYKRQDKQIQVMDAREDWLADTDDWDKFHHPERQDTDDWDKLHHPERHDTDDWDETTYQTRQEVLVDRHAIGADAARIPYHTKVAAELRARTTEEEEVADKKWWKGFEIIANELVFACSPMIGTATPKVPATMDADDDSVHSTIAPLCIYGHSGYNDCHHAASTLGYLPNGTTNRAKDRASIFREAEEDGNIISVDYEAEKIRLMRSRLKKKVKNGTGTRQVEGGPNSSTVTPPSSLLEVVRTTKIPALHDQLRHQSPLDTDVVKMPFPSPINPLPETHYPVILVHQDHSPEDTSTLDTSTTGYEEEHSSATVDDGSDHSSEIVNLVRQSRLSSVGMAEGLTIVKEGIAEGGAWAITDHGSNGSSITTMNYHTTKTTHGPTEQHVFRPKKQDAMEHLSKFADLQIMSSEHRLSVANEDVQHSAVKRSIADIGVSANTFKGARETMGLSDTTNHRNIFRNGHKFDTTIERRRRSWSSSSSSKRKKPRSPHRIDGNHRRNKLHPNKSAKRREGSTPTNFDRASTSTEEGNHPSVFKRGSAGNKNRPARLATNAMEGKTSQLGTVINPKKTVESVVQKDQSIGLQVSNNNSHAYMHVSERLGAIADRNGFTSDVIDKQDYSDEGRQSGLSHWTTWRNNMKALQDNRESIGQLSGHPFPFEPEIGSAISSRVNPSAISSKVDVHPIDAEELYIEYHRVKKWRDIQEMKNMLEKA
jgi:hypothetical protein